MACFYRESYLKFHSLERKKKGVGDKSPAFHHRGEVFVVIWFDACADTSKTHLKSHACIVCPDLPPLVLHVMKMLRRFHRFYFYSLSPRVLSTEVCFCIRYAGSHTDINVDLWDSHGSNCFSDILIVTWWMCVNKWKHLWEVLLGYFS